MNTVEITMKVQAMMVNGQLVVPTIVIGAQPAEPKPKPKPRAKPKPTVQQQEALWKRHRELAAESALISDQILTTLEDKISEVNQLREELAAERAEKEELKDSLAQAEADLQDNKDEYGLNMRQLELALKEALARIAKLEAPVIEIVNTTGETKEERRERMIDLADLEGNNLCIDEDLYDRVMNDDTE